jgi:putative holliday junction resolvase
MGRILGVDLGTRRVGLAITDPTRLISQPFRTVSFHSESRLVEDLARLAVEQDLERIVIGQPCRDGLPEGEICARARRLSEALSAMGVPCTLWDESWSSRDAEDILRAVGKNRRTAKEDVDRIAASLVLRDYLESTQQG